MDPPSISKTTSQNSIASTVSSVDSLEAVRKRVVSDFEFGETLGEGSYSTVMRATDKVKGRVYAVKILEKKHIIKENKVKYVTIEKDVLNQLSSPFIIKLYYTFQDLSSLYFVLEYCPNGDLLALIKKNGRFDQDAARFYGLEIALGLNHIHSHQILHRDLKPENILLDKRFHIKITDFGSAKILAQDDIDTDQNAESLRPRTTRSGSFVGTAEYCSPELLNDRAATTSSDIWALGCILFQMLVGMPPMQGPNEYQTFQKITKLDYSIPSALSKDASDLISGILRLDPAERPTLENLIQDPFFHGLCSSRIRSTIPPKLSYSSPLKLPGPNMDSLYMNPIAYFNAKNGTSSPPIDSLEPGPEDLLKSDDKRANVTSDTWIPDLTRNPEVHPEGILMSAVVKIKTSVAIETRGLLLDARCIYFYDLQSNFIVKTIPLHMIKVCPLDDTQFVIEFRSLSNAQDSSFTIQGLDGDTNGQDWVETNGQDWVEAINALTKTI